ncbi:pericentriolar material 1 protein-like isoform X1 [Mizuhopecten yessoensis]|uniref:Pericentriolar material 1 protein n=1 Tax=Mizuhopecten yessoensis TaxID=6573 RepID=A0A210QE80_MIZYE|nr:pericentriolar material 1 protein-like isoform X1 [Mizuhopecten yessoensis]OWF47060.1 Pericentriolar material 1 protein [Mizuhopecten yessoensis]
MATGGGRQFMKSASTDPKPRKAWQRSTSASDKDDNISIHSIPNDLRPNNWDFSGWKPNPGVDNTKRRKKGNPEREREQSLSLDSPPPSERQQRTPSTFPRTRITPSTPTSQRVALEKLRQHMTFSDLEDGSNDGERNNERNVLARRGKLENFTRQDTSSTSEGATAGKVPELQGEHGHIVSRLMQIREYIKQANTMKEALSKSGSPQNKEDYERVSKLVASLEEQEKGYVTFLAQYLSLKEDSTAPDWSNQGQETPLVMESADEEAGSVDLEVQSETSEATTQDNETSPLAWRPRIEDKLGLTDGDEDENNDNTERTGGDGSPGPDMMDNTLTAITDNLGGDWDYMHEDFEHEARMEVEEMRKNEVKSLRQQQELLKKLVHQQEQMKALKGRQTALLALQQNAELKLAEAKAGERLRALSAPATNTSQNHMSASQKPVSQAVDNNPQASRNTTEGLPGELQEIRQHLNYLRNELKEQTPETAERQSNPELEAATNAAALEDNRRQLQDKLLDLQSKKQRMDTLLQELQNLRSQRFDATLNNMPPLEPEIPVAVAAPAPNTALAMLEESKTALDEAGNTESNAQEILDILDAQEKLRKLQEVKQRLNQLRSLVQYYQSETTEGASEENTALAFRAQLDLMEEMHNLGVSGLAEGEPESQPLEPPSRKPYSMAPSAGAAAAAAAAQLKSDEDNRSEDSRSSESESHLSSLGPWGDDPEIQEKVQKLKEAKEKLRQLQDLVSIVQQSPDGARGLPDSLAELAASLECDEPPPAEPEDHLLSDGEVPMSQTERDSLEEAKNQLRELEALKDERRRLLTIQQELQALQGHFAGVSEKGEDDEEDGKTEMKEISDPAAEQDDDEEEDEEDKENQRPIRLSAPVVKFSSNDEVYGKMRKQRMMREELRQKKRELEAIMKKDNGNKKHYSKNQDNQSDTVSYSTDMYGASMSADATMATWGGSTVDNLESITEDNDRLDREEEDDDAYPSDGIIQVEEEEEENDSDNNTYTIEEDVRQRREARTQRHVATGASRAQDKKRRTFPRARKDPKDGARPKQGSWSKKAKQGRVKQENFRSPQELMQDDSPDGSKLLDTSGSQYEALQLQLQRTASMCQTLMGVDQSQNLPGMGLLQTSAMPSPGFGYRAGAMPDLFQQQMQQQQLMMNMSQCLQQMSMQQMEIQNLQRQIQGFTPDELRLRSLTSLSAPVDSRGLSPNIGALPRPDSFSQPPLSFLQRNSMDNLLSGQMLSEDNVFESDRRLGDGLTPGEQNERSRSLGRSFSTQSTGSKQRAHTERLMSRRNESLQQTSRVNESIPSHPISQARKKKKPASNQREWSQASGSKDGGAALYTGNTSDILNSLTQRVRPTGQRASQLGERPGLSAGISGAGFGDEGSIASTLSNRPQREAAAGRKKESREVDDPGDLTLFEALRESIYAEVATLISQNENRPHFLIELFRELQKLTSDYLRQRVLYSIKHLVSMFLTEQSAGPLTANTDEPLPAWMNSAGVGTASELTPSESNLTTDDEEITMQLRDLTIEKRRALARGESLQNDQFDYVEAADYDSSLSTPSTSYWDNPFSQDLGDTVIHLDKALKKMRENESKQAATEKAWLDSKKQKPEQARPSRPVSEPTSSSAVDQGSESSVSSTSYSRIDTQELNKQIKMIMKEVIPVIKEHIDHVCSYELLAYIKRLVLSLTRQYDSSQYATFFHAQLSSALHDTLSKFEGRKLRMCGEDLLVDMSEVLFNELAFFRLMQGLSENPATASQQQVQSSGTQTREEADQSVEEEDTQTQESDTTESTVTDDDDSEQDPSLRLNAAEEEELGKLRDDEFASEVQIQDADDKDDDTASPYKAVQIELAVSETKPFTRIGSDEDDEDADESQSADDPSETAVSRDAMMEKSHSLEDGDDLEMPEEETQVSDANEGDADQGANTVGDSTGDRDSEGGIRMNGEVLQNGEMTIDDLPNSLNLAPMVDIQNKMSEEQQNNSSVEAVLASINVPEELAGDGQSLKEPGPPTYPPMHDATVKDM